jgi:hypothetical protein
MEMVAMLESGVKEQNACIPLEGLLRGDYVKLINRHPELMDDSQPSIGQ